MKKPSFIVALLLMSAGWVSAATSSWQVNDQGQVRLVAPYKTAPASGEIYFGLEFKTRHGWHVYWKNAGDAGYAPKLDWKESSGLEHPELLWPAPHRYELSGDLVAFGYEGKVVYPIRATVQKEAREIRLKVEVSYLTCEDSCIPYKYTFSLRLPVAQVPEDDSTVSSLVTEALGEVPLPVSDEVLPELLKNDLRFTLQKPVDTKQLNVFFEKNADLDFGKPAQVNPTTLEVTVKGKDGASYPDKSEIDYVVTGLRNGHRIYAVEGKKELVFPEGTPVGASHAQPTRTPLAMLGNAAQHGWLGLLILAFLGGLILNVMPCVLPVLSLKLMGLMEQSGHSRLDIMTNTLVSAAGVLFSFLGLALGAIFLRHAGHYVGWGIQFQEPIFVGCLSIIVLLFTLNLWGLFEVHLSRASTWASNATSQDGLPGYFASGMFATLLATPCTAPFLAPAMGFALTQTPLVILSIFGAAGLGMASPYFLIAIFPGALRLLPRPGIWMSKLKILLGAFLALTLIWLGFILSSQVDKTGFYIFHALLLAIAFLVWVFSRRGTVWVFVGLLSLGSLAVLHETRRVAAPVITDAMWQPFDAATLQHLNAEGKTVFVDMTAEWCFTCKVNERGVLASSDVMQAFKNANIVLMRGDWTNKNAMIAAYLSENGRNSIPFYAIHRPNRPPQILPTLLTSGLIQNALKEQ